jgi:hypothetical protein
MARNAPEPEESDEIARRRLDLVESGLERLSRAVDHLTVAITGDPSELDHKPGALMRIDRIERNVASIKWLATGGLLSLFGTIYALVKMAEALHGLK